MKRATQLWMAVCLSGMIVSCTDPGRETAGKASAEIPSASGLATGKEEGPPAKAASLPGSEAMEFSIEYLTGKFDPATHPDFVQVDARYTDGDTYYLRKDTYESFMNMWEAAKASGVNLVIISATRNFERQKSIWEAKWTGARKIENGADASQRYPDPKERALKILEYSSMPGTSRHHWGTDIDLNDLENNSFESGQGKLMYEWMQKHAAEFGFCQPYTAKGPNRPFGYEEEKWHWSYIPVAQQLTSLAASKLRNEMISGFQGAEAAGQIDVVQKYVLGINQACK